MLLPSFNPPADLNCAVKLNVDPNKFVCLPTKKIAAANTTNAITTNIPNFHLDPGSLLIIIFYLLDEKRTHPTVVAFF
jgi:hypothetical protein